MTTMKLTNHETDDFFLGPRQRNLHGQQKGVQVVKRRTEALRIGYEASPVQPLKDAIRAIEQATKSHSQSMRTRLLAVEKRITALERKSHTTMVINSLASEDIEVLKPIYVTVEFDGADGFIASFMDAGVSSGGQTELEAFCSLQDAIRLSFETTEKLPDASLGPKMLRQKQVFSDFICRRSLRHTQKNSPGN